MSKNPVFSVIVPFYNVETYIVECLQSILGQTFKDFEVLCVDDCGNDLTSDIVNLFAQKDKRIKIIKHKKNKGLGTARNTGLKHAKGKYIVCVDSDDYITSDLLQNVYNAFMEHECRVVWFSAKLYSHYEQKFLDFIAFNTLSSQKEGLLNINQNNLMDFPQFSWNKAYEKDLLLENNIFWKENKLFEDIELYWKIHTKIHDVYYINKPLYIYRKRPGSICSNKNNIPETIADLYSVTEDVYKYLIHNHLFTDYRNCLLKFIYIALSNKHPLSEYHTELNQKTLQFLKNIDFN